VEVRIIQHDFTKAYDAATFQSMYDQHLAELDVSILHNNVGIAPLDDFIKYESKVYDCMTANAYSGVLLTKAVVESFKRRYQKDSTKRSLICFTGAMMTHGKPKIGQIYSASKTIYDFLAHGLNHELKEFNVDVCSWRAAGVATKIVGHKDAPLNPGMTSPENYCLEAFSKCTAGVHHGWINHEVLGFVLDFGTDLWPDFGNFAMSKLCTFAKANGAG